MIDLEKYKYKKYGESYSNGVTLIDYVKKMKNLKEIPLCTTNGHLTIKITKILFNGHTTFEISLRAGLPNEDWVNIGQYSILKLTKIKLKKIELTLLKQWEIACEYSN